MSNPPSTPPRLRNSSQPVFHTTFRTPKTPKGGVSKGKEFAFATPSSLKKQKGLFATPRKQLLQLLHVLQLLHECNPLTNFLLVPTPTGQGFPTLMPITPEITPLRSPNRSTRKKRIHVDEIAIDNPVQKLSRANESSSDCSFGLLLPAPSTIGMGRKLPSPPIKSAPLNSSSPLDSDFFANIAHEEDLDEYPSPSSSDFILKRNLNFMPPIDYEQIQLSPTKPTATPGPSLPPPSSNMSRKPSTSQKSKFNTPRLPLNHILTTPKMMHTPKMPQTPADQLIDEDIVYKWHGKSFNSDFSTDDEAHFNDNIEIEDVENPFISPNVLQLPHFRPPFTPKPVKQSNVDYSTHMELVNNKTGERNVIALLEEQAKIKPKRLDFTSFK